MTNKKPAMVAGSSIFNFGQMFLDSAADVGGKPLAQKQSPVNKGQKIFPEKALLQAAGQVRFEDVRTLERLTDALQNKPDGADALTIIGLPYGRSGGHAIELARIWPVSAVPALPDRREPLKKITALAYAFQKAGVAGEVAAPVALVRMTPNSNLGNGFHDKQPWASNRFDLARRERMNDLSPVAVIAPLNWMPKVGRDR